MSSNLFKSFKYTVDGITNHTQFPPGYPIIIGLEKFVLIQWNNVFLFNYLIIGTFNALIIFYIFKKNFNKFYSNLFFPFCFLFPTFITSRLTLDSSTEYIFSFFIWLGIFFFFESLLKKNNIKFLLISNILFSISYILREEGLVIFLCFIFINLLILRKTFFKFKIFLIYFFPILLFIFPYIIYLYLNLGFFTLSGKESALFADNISRIENPDLWPETASIFNFNFVNSDFINLTFNKINYLIDLLISPNFINPIMYVGIILLFIQIILKKILIRDLNKLLFLIFPTLILLFLLTFRYYPVARAIYVFLPVFVISSFIGLNQFLFFYIKKGFHKYIYFFIFVFFIISIIFPLNMEVNISNPILYVKSMKLIEKDIKKGECVFARDNDILEYYFPNIRIIKQLNSNNNDIIIKDCIPKYLLLSNIEHVSLPNMTKFESENMNFQNIYINNNNYIYVGELTRKKYKVNTYKIKN